MTRGKPSNNQLSLSLRQSIKSIILTKYPDFGPTLAWEKLRELDHINVSLSSVRRIMLEDQIWLTRTNKLKRSYQPRYRRAAFGELVQIDGSDHDWFEGRSPKCNLLVYVDDATSQLMALRFVPHESAFTYFQITKEYLLHHGKPLAFYSDKLGVFRVNQKSDKNEIAVTDAVTYPGFIQTLQSLNISLTTIPVNFTNGMDVNELENLCKKTPKPKFLYTMSDGHNPLGTSLSKEKRLKLTEIAQTYRIPIIEDDAYGFLNYQAVEPPLKAYSNDWVFYIGSFSKILAPSARVGWIIAPEDLIIKLEILKESSDINTATLSQRIISAFLDKNDFTKHLFYIQESYKEKRDKMVKALKQHIPELVFVIPSSGFLIWGQLPSSIDTYQLFWQALKNEKVSFLPGIAFGNASDRRLNHCLRLSFSYCPLELIEIGVERLANAIKNYTT